MPSPSRRRLPSTAIDRLVQEGLRRLCRFLCRARPLQRSKVRRGQPVSHIVMARAVDCDGRHGERSKLLSSGMANVRIQLRDGILFDAASRGSASVEQLQAYGYTARCPHRFPWQPRWQGKVRPPHLYHRVPRSSP